MSISLIIFISIHLLVFAYVVEMLRKIAHRHREYPLDETRETLPFGFLHLRYLIILLILTYVAWIIFTIWLYGYFVGDLFGVSSGGFNDAILNL